MGFNSSMPYSLNPQLQKQVDEQEAGRNYYKNLIAGPQEDVIKKQVWANGLGDNIVGQYNNSQVLNSGANQLDSSFSALRDQDRQTALTYGLAGKPNIINNNMNPKQNIDPVNVGESGQLNTFKPLAQDQAAKTYGGQLEKTAAMSPFTMKIDPSTAYSAMDALKAVQNLNLNNQGKTNYRRDTAAVNSSIGLPGLPTSSTGGSNAGGSYSNPAPIIPTQPNNTTNKYSFLNNGTTNTNSVSTSNLPDSEHRNSLGFFKRDKLSLDARIIDANLRGKTKKENRLRKKLTNFENYQSGKGKGFIGRAIEDIGNIFK